VLGGGVVRESGVILVAVLYPARVFVGAVGAIAEGVRVVVAADVASGALRREGRAAAAVC
jgi:hypothetical protein